MIHSHTTPPPDNSIPVGIPPSEDPETEIPRNTAKCPKHLTRNRTIPLSDFQGCGTSHETQWNLPEIHFPLEGRKFSYCTKFQIHINSQRSVHTREMAFPNRTTSCFLLYTVWAKDAVLGFPTLWNFLRERGWWLKPVYSGA